ncbi:N-acetyltransferase [Streptomyces sp. ISL-10]|uniref:peptidogalycan biosysnthesis protein n=1 Tax=Streptomyces sp. ISL-10 TaxID=2819172 RepID=UPI001BE7BC59|nr:peptidogalycan biosysnthesis protein [Streptomyces sp. ISL-10]MBT2365565.1 N-acetyltransferase [Streptomyces sp. ISL-10]
MKRWEHEGLRIASVDVGEALDRNWWEWAWQGEPPADVIRVENPAPEVWPALEEAGFITKPGWVNWQAELRDSEDAFLAALSGSERRNIRLGRRFAAEHGIKAVVERGPSATSLEAFLEMYDAQITAMRNGIPYARRQQKDILRDRDCYVGVFAYHNARMVGGCLCQIRADQAMLQLRFAAAEPSARGGRLQRAVYMDAFQAARDLGLSRMSLGNDPTLYGHIADPGLFGFKSRLGFVPVPSHLIDPDIGGTEADLILSMNALADPSLLLAYAHTQPPQTPRPDGPTTRPPLRLVVLTARTDEHPPDIARHRAGFLTRVDIRTVPSRP